MNNLRTNKVGAAALAIFAFCFISVSQAQEILVDASLLDQAMDVLGAKYTESAEVQDEITQLANSASSTFELFKRSNDNLESLLVLNAGWRMQISIQEDQIETLDESIASVE